MPTLPTVQLREQAPRRQLPEVGAPAGAYVARGLQRLAESFGAIDAEYEISEARRIAGEQTANIKGGIELADVEVNDPDEFVNRGTEAIASADAAVKGIENPRIRQRVLSAMADNFKAAETAVKVGKFKKEKDKVLANFAENEARLIDRAASQDEATRNAAGEEYAKEVASLASSNFIEYTKAQKHLKDFSIKALKKMASNEMEADAGVFLRNLQSGKFDALDVDTRLALRRSANAAVTAQITMQTRDQKQKAEAADRELQTLFDQGAGADVIIEKLKAFSGAGVIDRNDRKFWDDKLLRGEKGDDPAQLRNLATLKSEFLDAYPTPARIKEFRERKRTMERLGELGDKGAAEIGNILITAERSINAEGRANRAEARAEQGRKEREDKMTLPQARDLISRNYPNANPNRPVMPAHKEDMKQLTERAMLGDEDPGKVAREIYTERQKIKAAEDKRKKDQAAAAQNDPKAKEILERLKGLPKK